MMEDWTDIIGEQLENIEEPLPADDWSVLQQKYAASRRKKRAAAFVWGAGFTSVAAAIALVLLLVRPDASSVIPASTGDVLVSETLPTTDEIIPDDTDAVAVPIDTASRLSPTAPKKASTPVTVVQKAVDDTFIAEDTSKGHPDDTFDVIQDTTSLKDRLLADASAATKHEDEYAEADGSNGFEDFPEGKPRRKRRSVSIGLSGSTSDSPIIMKAYDAAIPELPMDQEPPYTGDVNTPEDSLVTDTPQPSMAMLKTKKGYIDSYSHEVPVSIGVSARIHLTYRFSINTGLNYTKYTSTRTRRFTGTSDKQTDKQHVHYLGIPVRLDFTAVNKKHFNFYMGAGMQMDKCIYATVGTERLHEKQVLFGLNGTMGIQINIVPSVGLYFEPEVSYALNKGTIETFRSDEPFVITVRGGLRFNF